MLALGGQGGRGAGGQRGQGDKGTGVQGEFLASAFCVLSFVFCLLPFVFCLLPSAFCVNYSSLPWIFSNAKPIDKPTSTRTIAKNAALKISPLIR
jgi:hypothetical protein